MSDKKEKDIMVNKRILARRMSHLYDDLTGVEAYDMIEKVLGGILDSLEDPTVKGVVFLNAFTLTKVTRKERYARDICRGERIKVPAYNELKIMTGKKLKENINPPAEHGTYRK